MHVRLQVCMQSSSVGVVVIARQRVNRTSCLGQNLDEKGEHRLDVLTSPHVLIRERLSVSQRMESNPPP